MTKTREIYRRSICGNIVEVLHEGAVLSCCGKPMELLKGNSTDGAYEKHVPVVEKVEGGFKVKVGAVEHPMVEGHYIQWIELLTPFCVMRRELHPGDKPEALFLVDPATACGQKVMSCDVGEIRAREYCNLHGLYIL